MTSEKQIEANRQNARKSTGPRTQEGKDRVSNNAVKHGLLSQDVLSFGEDRAALRDLSERLQKELEPVGELEDMLVDRIVAAYWRLRRVGRVEADIFARLSAVSNSLGGAFMHDSHHANAFSKLSRYETPIEKSLYKALHELQRLQAAMPMATSHHPSMSMSTSPEAPVKDSEDGFVRRDQSPSPIETESLCSRKDSINHDRVVRKPRRNTTT